MKALAAEIVCKLSKRLNWMEIQVRELTGEFVMHVFDKYPLLPREVGMSLTKNR